MSGRTSCEPAVSSWADLSSPDVEASKRYYAGLLGWAAQDAGPAEESGRLCDVHAQRRGDRGRDAHSARAARRGSRLLADVLLGPHCDASVAKVQELAGSAPGPTHEMEGVGRFAVVADPHGATFGVIAGEPPEG
jgi:predicted enzyme related to lactoylglutathione lyase